MKEHFTNNKAVLGILLLLVFYAVTFNLNFECRLRIVKIDKGFCSCVLILCCFFCSFRLYMLYKGT